MTKHTMFPKDWDEARIRAEVTSAWEKRIVKDDRWKGTSSGVQIEDFISPNRTAYPIYEKLRKLNMKIFIRASFDLGKASVACAINANC